MCKLLFHNRYRIQQKQIIKESILSNVRQKIIAVCVSCYFITDTAGLQAVLYDFLMQRDGFFLVITYGNPYQYCHLISFMPLYYL